MGIISFWSKLFYSTSFLTKFLPTAGLYVLCSEPVKIPWFDSVLADIGDEQSLSQSLSTFSGHLKQISVSWGLIYDLKSDWHSIILLVIQNISSHLTGYFTIPRHKHSKTTGLENISLVLWNTSVSHNFLLICFAFSLS